jgi:phosphatidylglycerol:prolipoprotein diacylglycerol transferase
MLNYPQIDPVAFHLGPIAVHWYGLTYLFAFTACWAVLSLRIKHSSFPRGFTADQLSDIVFYSAIGTIIGGRLGYMLFYATSDLVANPWLLFKVWNGGMSFHGGLLGVFIALWLYAKKMNKSVFDITDFIAPAVPLGLGAGRVGNFINGELWGRVTDVPWGMIFPNAGIYPRHPSQLYELLLEGFLLFVILWIFSRKPRPRFAVTGLFLMCYATFRFLVEFFREPDFQIGFVAFGWLTKGQLLSIPMFLLGVVLFSIAYKGQKKWINT